MAQAGFRAVWIARPDAGAATLERLAAAGADVLPEGTLALQPSVPPGYAPVVQALRLGAPCICNLVSADLQLAGWEAEARRLDIASLAVCPAFVGGGVQAVVAFYAREPGCFDRELVSVITQIAAEVAGVLERFAGREQRHHIDALRRAAEQQLYRFRSLVESASDTFYIVSPAEGFRLVYVNDAGVRHFGWPREQLLAMRLWEWDPNFTPETTRALWEMVRTRGSTLFETTTQGRDGSRVRVEMAASLLRTDEGEFLAGYFRDISARARAEAELREREERLHEQALLLDEATDAIIVCDGAGLIQVWNHGAERLLGWTREEAVGRHAGTLHFPDPHAFATTLASARDHGMWNGELEYRTRDDARVLVESRWTLRSDSSGAPRALLTINSDITERKRREATQLRAQRLESIGTLAGGIAHDLNNILAPVVLSSDILRLRTKDPGDLELIHAIGASARRGAEIVRQVLSFARGTEGTHIPVNIRHLLPEIRHIVSETFPRSIACRAEAPHDLWPVMGEPTQLHQVLLNLCLNSRDAMPEGGTITVRAANLTVDAELAARFPHARPGPYVRIQVIDTGSGIPPEVRDRIFEPFFTTKGPGRGTGLGLSTAMAIVRSHRGFITLDSESGRGTTVSAHFPAEQPAGTPAEPPPPAAPAEASGRGEFILVIDDEASVRSITRQSLESAGYRVLTAEDGARGISLFVQHRDQIALVLTDIMMPVMDGVAVIKALRRIAPTARIIAVSGATDASTVAQSFSPSPGVGFLLKPFNLESLLRAVHESLGSSANP